MTTAPATSASAGPFLSSRAILEIVAAIIVLALAMLGFHEWRSAHDAMLQAQAIEKSEKADIASLQKQRDTLTAGDKARDAKAAATITELTKQAAAVKTPKQIVKWLPTQIPLPQSLSIELPPATLQNPTPEAIASIPQADLAPLKDFIVQGKTCAVELPAAQQDLTSCQSQLKLAGEQMSAVERERDAYKKASKGTWLSRTLKVTKYIAIGAGIGYLLAKK
ncbi:MAG: hypothetical protein ACRD4S_17050 [Candidatus Acidiferrales bacterium]